MPKLKILPYEQNWLKSPKSGTFTSLKVTFYVQDR